MEDSKIIDVNQIPWKDDIHVVDDYTPHLTEDQPPQPMMGSICIFGHIVSL